MINHSDKKVKPKIWNYISHQMFKGKMQNIQKIVSFGFLLGDMGVMLFSGVQN